MKKLLVLCLVAVSFVIIVSSSSFASADSHPEIPGNMTHAQREQVFSNMVGKSNAAYTGNYFIMILKTPDGSELDNFVINSTDMDKTRNDVGFFTLCGAFDNRLCQPPIPTTSQPTSDFCEIAWLVHLHEDGYNNTKVGNSTIWQVTTPPAYCSAPAIPEFGSLVSIILVGSISCLIFVTRKRV